MRIAVVGSESCGKSTLAAELSQALQCGLQVEYSREYFATHPHSNYQLEDIIAIATEQQRRENALAQQHHLLICDTNALVNRIWAEVKFGHCPTAIAQLDQANNYTHTLLCTPDLPWQADPLRENPTDRQQLFTLYLEKLQASGAAYSIISGTGAARTLLALKIINSLGISI